MTPVTFPGDYSLKTIGHNARSFVTLTHNFVRSHAELIRMAAVIPPLAETVDTNISRHFSQKLSNENDCIHNYPVYEPCLSDNFITETSLSNLSGNL